MIPRTYEVVSGNTNDIKGVGVGGVRLRVL